MDLAKEALGYLLSKLAQLLHDEYNLQAGAKEDIEFLSKELETIHAALCVVGEVPREQLDNLQRIWTRDVREMSYDMEDIVDSFMVRLEGPDPHSAERTFKVKYMKQKLTNFKTNFMANREIAEKIKDIKERAKERAERRDRYKDVANSAPSKKTLVDPRLNALYTDATKLVGIEEAKEEVIARLTRGDADQQERIVVSIAGLGGLGKTTLAKAVYDEIKGQFDRMAFVSVSRDPDAKTLLKDILYELPRNPDEKKHLNDNLQCEPHEGGHPDANLNEIRRLIDLVHDFLRNKRYLIVIDDIWETEPWDKVMKFALMENNMRSRIITTTRKIGVAEHIGGCYKLKPLSDESSEILFYGRIFGSKDKCPMQFSEVSKNILKKCGGVPLAIVTTSSLLANKSDIRVWNDVCNSIGSGLGRNPSMDDMRKILLLSYYDLPSHLKTCFLYLSTFPEDYKIEKGRLIWRWVAEGFIQQPAKDQSFLEIGESYFNELINRSLIQPEDMTYDMAGTPHACRVHDTVLDLIILLLEEECFVTTVLAGDGKESKKVRRLALHNNNNSTTWPTMEMPKLRSLTIFTPASAVIDLTSSLSRYLLLRVLDLRGCKLNDLASLGFVGSLSHLRYLGVPDSRVGPYQLPVEIGKLHFLQTLDLYGTSVNELSSSVIKGLGQLMCLRGSWIYQGIRLPYGLKELTSLEVLKKVVVTSGRIAEELGHLTKLRVLKLYIEVADEDELTAACEYLLESIGKLTKVECLDIVVGSREHYVNLNGSMVPERLGNLDRLCIAWVTVMPTWIGASCLPVISYLEILTEYEQRGDIQVLGTLPCLRHLRFIVYQEGAVERCALGADAFP